MLDDVQPGVLELVGKPRLPATVAFQFGICDPEECSVLRIVARIDLLRDEPSARRENARDLVDVEAFVPVDNKMERLVSER